MVSLSTAYGLCSLIDQEGFVHVSEDDSECAIVTLGKNIAIRYRVGLNDIFTSPFLVCITGRAV